MLEIPPNFTNVLQPNDQYINKVLKDKLTRLYDDHMWTVCATLPAPNLSLTYLKPLLLKWFDQASTSISVGVVKSSWTKATEKVRPQGQADQSVPAVVLAKFKQCDCIQCFAQIFRPRSLPPLLMCCSCCSSVAPIKKEVGCKAGSQQQREKVVQARL